jgi:hypothetical protein
MPAFGSDPDDTPPVDSGYESSATSMLSGLSRESQGSQWTSSDQAVARLPEQQEDTEQPHFSKNSSFASSSIGDARGYGDAVTAQAEESNAYEATKIFVERSRQAAAKSSTRPQPTGLFDRLQRYLPALLILNALLLITLILLLTLPGIAD